MREKEKRRVAEVSSLMGWSFMMEAGLQKLGGCEWGVKGERH